MIRYVTCNGEPVFFVDENKTIEPFSMSANTRKIQNVTTVSSININNLEKLINSAMRITTLACIIVIVCTVRVCDRLRFF